MSDFKLNVIFFPGHFEELFTQNSGWLAEEVGGEAAVQLVFSKLKSFVLKHFTLLPHPVADLSITIPHISNFGSDSKKFGTDLLCSVSWLEKELEDIVKL